RISREIRVNRRGKFFALNKTFSQALVVETYPLCRRIRFWHSATENVSAQQYADQGWEGTPLLHGGGESASAVGESGAAAGVVPGRNQRQSASGMAQNAGGAGGESVDRSGQRVSSAPAVVRSQRHGRFAGAGFCGGGERSAVPVSGSGAGA